MTTISILPKIRKTYTYESYKSMALELAENESTTGVKTDEHIAATKINAQRLKRIDKQCELNPELQETIRNFKRNCTWILIAESWCGDGAQCIPVIAKIAAQSTFIELKLILRDEHPEAMDIYLTDGKRSIPKLICIDKYTNQEIGMWGPRPARIQDMVNNYTLENPTASHEEFVKNLHLWYAKDQTKSVQEDFTHLLKQWHIAKP